MDVLIENCINQLVNKVEVTKLVYVLEIEQDRNIILGGSSLVKQSFVP